MPRGVDMVLSTGDSNDAALLIPELLVLMPRSLESLKNLHVILAYDLEI